MGHKHKECEKCDAAKCGIPSVAVLFAFIDFIKIGDKTDDPISSK